MNCNDKISSRIDINKFLVFLNRDVFSPCIKKDKRLKKEAFAYTNVEWHYLQQQCQLQTSGHSQLSNEACKKFLAADLYFLAASSARPVNMNRKHFYRVCIVFLTRSRNRSESLGEQHLEMRKRAFPQVLRLFSNFQNVENLEEKKCREVLCHSAPLLRSSLHQEVLWLNSSRKKIVGPLLAVCGLTAGQL